MTFKGDSQQPAYVGAVALRHFLGILRCSTEGRTILFVREGLSPAHLLSICTPGFPAQRPLNECEPETIEVASVGTSVCSPWRFAPPSVWDAPPSPCPRCGHDAEAALWVVRPCGHRVCEFCAVDAPLCTVCGNGADGSRPTTFTVERSTDEGTTFKLLGDGSVRDYVYNEEGMQEQVVAALARLCDGEVLKDLLGLLTATAQHALSSRGVSEEVEAALLHAVIVSAPRLVLPRLVNAFRQNGTGLWWHGVVTNVVKLFTNLGTFRGRPIDAANIVSACQYWSRVQYARGTYDDRRAEAATRIQACWRGWTNRQECVICLEKGGCRNLGCACRGAAAWCHTECLVALARSKKGTERGRAYYKYCSICRQEFDGPHQTALIDASIGHLDELPMSDSRRHLTYIALAEYMVRSDPQESLQILLQVKDGLAKVGGVPEDTMVPPLELAMAEAEFACGHTKRAIARMNNAYRVFGTSYGSEDVFALEAALKLSIFMMETRHLSQARRVLEQFLPAIERCRGFGPNSAEVLHYGRMSLHSCRVSQNPDGDSERADWWRAFYHLRRVYGHGHRYTVFWIAWRQERGIPYAPEE